MKASFLIEFRDEHEAKRFENWIEFNGANIQSVTILPNTETLYENDSVFKAMVSAEKKAKKIKNDYINSHNQ